jgi:signal transduction histidine kinase
VIEDALDFTRLENNKFTIFKELFNIRDTAREVKEIMAFTLDQKNI